MFDPHTQSFITKIWLEESATEGGSATWRGTITHVPSGERRYVQDLYEVLAFIAPFLERMGVRLGVWLRMKLWLRHWKLCLTRRS
jgi:hypothetical protein